MAKKQTKATRDLLRQKIALMHLDGKKAVNPPSRRRTPWRGAAGHRERVLGQIKMTMDLHR